APSNGPCLVLPRSASAERLSCVEADERRISHRAREMLFLAIASMHATCAPIDAQPRWRYLHGAGSIAVLPVHGCGTGVLVVSVRFGQGIQYGDGIWPCFGRGQRLRLRSKYRQVPPTGATDLKVVLSSGMSWRLRSGIKALSNRYVYVQDRCPYFRSPALPTCDIHT
ncbi:hypothetical protein CCMA1212_000684, partial [Trichoderma ghanense]